ncbi:MAG: MarR family winged helix-turn-helix transcriptional regulator [Jatrophihabitans sp.]
MTAPDEESLADAFWSVAARLRRQSRHTLGAHEILPSQARALGTLVRHGNMRLRELSEYLRIAPRSTTEVVDALEERGLVGRRPDSGDRRATLVEVTDEGRRTHDAFRDARREQAEQIFAGLSAKDRTELARILRKLID